MNVISKEEEQFNKTIDQGLGILAEMISDMEKKEEKNEDKKEGRYLRREFSYSKFQQTMVLPENAEKEKIEAKVENGVLNIIIPKMSEEAAKKAEKIIEIK